MMQPLGLGIRRGTSLLRWARLFLFAVFLLLLVESDEAPPPPPNILFVLIDDLGWGDVGFHVHPNHQQQQGEPHQRREVQTPTMDRLAQEEGMQLNRHYVHSSCTGTRTALQSGRFPVHVQTKLQNPEDPSSGMPRNMTGFAEYLKRNDLYATHYVGKWDVGMASWKHTPKGRGYDTSLNYFEHKNDYWTQACAQSACCQALLQPDNHQQQQQQQGQQPIYDLWETDRPARTLVGTDYEEFIFQRRMLDIIDQHAANQTHQHQQQQPLFLFYAPHLAHCPLQVPKSYLDQFDFVDNDEDMCRAQTPNIVGPDNPTPPPPYSCRKQYHAMVKVLDEILKSLVDRLKQHGMWDNTLMVVTSDNGGPVNPLESAATNFPLRGGKYSDWEGGVRATAFISGGYLPQHKRGTILRHPIHICDWYATLPALAGINVTREEEKQRDALFPYDPHFPPVDAVDIWPLIMNSSSDYTEPQKSNVHSRRRITTAQSSLRRHEIPLSKDALIVGDFKLIWREHGNVSLAGWTYPDYPNAQTQQKEIDHQTINCSAGCLFNVETDPGEHYNVADKEPILVQTMKQRLKELRNGFFENDDRGIDSCPNDLFNTNDGDSSGNNDLPCACWMAVNYYGGFLGPYQEVDIGAGPAA